MLLGHIGIGFAGKAIEKKMPLWVLLIAVMIPDLMSFIFSVIGLPDERGFWSHSLFMTTVFSVISAVVIYLIYRNFYKVLLFCGLIISHWICDFLSWPLEVIGINNRISLFSAERTYGLGLYKTVPIALLCEFILLISGIGLYIYSRRIKKRSSTSEG